METVIHDFIAGLKPGDMLEFKNMAVVPLFGEAAEGPRYITMKEALEKKHIAVKEVSEGGSVPDLLVENKSELSVLLLDGEELAGAKQNRILNTTILVLGGTTIVVPVSCTEHGRWSYASREFRDSDNIMAYGVRRKKTRSVSESLKSREAYLSDQGEVWDGIHEMSAKMGVSSATGAMKDAMDGRRADLDAYANAFPLSDGQIGLMVFIGGKAVGFEAVSRAGAYADYHPRLVRSYTVDALYAKGGEAGLSAGEVKGFLDEATRYDGSTYKSRGAGSDWRYEGKGVVGSALEYGGTAIHAAFFRFDEAGENGGRGRAGGKIHRRGRGRYDR